MKTFIQLMLFAVAVSSNVSILDVRYFFGIIPILPGGERNPQLTDDDLNDTIYVEFDTVDQSKDGFVSVDEIAARLGEINETIPREQIVNSVISADVDKDLQLDLAEFDAQIKANIDIALKTEQKVIDAIARKKQIEEEMRKMQRDADEARRLQLEVIRKWKAVMAEKKAKEEAERKVKEEAERKAKEEAERQAKEEAWRLKLSNLSKKVKAATKLANKAANRAKGVVKQLGKLAEQLAEAAKEAQSSAPTTADDGAMDDNPPSDVVVD